MWLTGCTANKKPSSVETAFAQAALDARVNRKGGTVGSELVKEAMHGSSSAWLISYVTPQSVFTRFRRAVV